MSEPKKKSKNGCIITVLVIIALIITSIHSCTSQTSTQDDTTTSSATNSGNSIINEFKSKPKSFLNALKAIGQGWLNETLIVSEMSELQQDNYAFKLATNVLKAKYNNNGLSSDFSDAVPYFLTEQALNDDKTLEVSIAKSFIIKRVLNDNGDWVYTLEVDKNRFLSPVYGYIDARGYLAIGETLYLLSDDKKSMVPSYTVLDFGTNVRNGDAAVILNGVQLKMISSKEEIQKYGDLIYWNDEDTLDPNNDIMCALFVKTDDPNFPKE